MADFKTHITVSTTLGVVYAGGAYLLFGVPAPACVVAGGLCSISGMIPDLDSDSGVPFRETISLLAAVVPMLMLNRFQHLGWSEESMACAAILIYITIRFGLAELFRRYTVHRGMWHSIPAAAIAGLVAFLVVSGENFNLRLYKSAAVVLGFMSHLVLDEIWSVKVGITGVHVKRSFGTAIKFFGNTLWGNVSTYGKLILVALLALSDPVLMERFELGDHQAPQMTRELFNRFLGRIEQAATRLEQGQGWRLVPRKPPPAPSATAATTDSFPQPDVPDTSPHVMPAAAEEMVPIETMRHAELPDAPISQ